MTPEKEAEVMRLAAEKPSPHTMALLLVELGAIHPTPDARKSFFDDLRKA